MGRMRFRRAALALVAAAGLAGLAGCATSGPTPLCDQARGLVDEGQLAQAAELFARAQVRNEGVCADDGLTEVGDRYTMAYTDAARGSAAEIEGRTDLARSAYESALRLDAGNQAASNGLVRLGLPPAERSAPLPLPAVAPYPQASWWTGWQIALPALVLAVLAVLGVGLLWRRGGIGRSRSGSSDRPEPDEGSARPAAFLEWRGRGWRRSRAREENEDLEPLRPVGREEERGVRSVGSEVPTGDGEEWSGGVGVGRGRAGRGSEADSDEATGAAAIGGAALGGAALGGAAHSGAPGGTETEAGAGGAPGGTTTGSPELPSAEAGAAEIGGAGAGGAAIDGATRRAEPDGSPSAEAGAAGGSAAGGGAPGGAPGRSDLGRSDQPTSAETPTARKERPWLSRGRDLGRGRSKRGRRTQQQADARWARMREEAEPETAEVLPPDSRPLPTASGGAAAAGVRAAGEVAAERQEAEPSSTPREVEPTPRREAEPSPRSAAQPSVRAGADASDRSEPEPTGRGDAEPSARSEAESAEQRVASVSKSGTARPGQSEAEPSDRAGDEPPGRDAVESTERRDAEASGEPRSAPSGRGGAQPSDRGGGETVDDREALASGSASATAAHLSGAPPSDRSEGKPAEQREAPASGAAGITAAESSEARRSDRSKEEPADKREAASAGAAGAPTASPESEPSAQQDQPDLEQRESRTGPAEIEPPTPGDAGSTASPDAASAEPRQADSERPARPSAAGAVAAGLGAVAAQASAGRGTARMDKQAPDSGVPSASAAGAEPVPPAESAVAGGPGQPTEPSAGTPAEGATDSEQPPHTDEPPATPAATAPTDRSTRTVVEAPPEPTTPSDDELFEERAAAEAPTVPEAAPAAAGAAVAAVGAQVARPAQTGPPAEKAEAHDPALRSHLATLDLELGQLQRILNRSLRTNRDGGPPRFFAAREPVKGPAVAITLEIVSLQLTGGDHTGSTVCVRRTVFAERPPGPWVPEDPDNRWQDVAEELDHRASGSIRDSDGRMWITPGREELRGILLDLDRVRPAWLPLLLGDEPSASLPLSPPPSDQVTGLKAALDGAQPLVSPQPRPSGVRLLAIVDALLVGPVLTNVRVDAVANEVLALAAAESVEHELDRHLVPLGR